MSAASLSTPGSQEQNSTCSEVSLANPLTTPPPSEERKNEEFAYLFKEQDRLLNFQKSKLAGVIYLVYNMKTILVTGPMNI